MRDDRFVIDIAARRIPVSVGTKAHNLRWLLKNGFRIPVTVACDWRAYHQFLEKDAHLLPRLKQELAGYLDVDRKYAVRSSANLEDSRDLSFAGQFKSILDVQGLDSVLAAVVEVWESSSSPAVESYQQRRKITPSQVSMAVVIQEMVPALASGVALSCNPVNGADEIIVEAVPGTGESLVQEGVSPSRWVSKWGTWLSTPNVETIPLDLAEQIVNETRRIAHLRKSPVDLEWAWDGSRLTWLQVRAITALPPRDVYSNFMAKEMLPGMIKPLVWSVNIPMKSSVFLRFMDEMLGKTGINPSEMIKSFYYRVYFNMGVIGQAFKKLGLPAESVEMMNGMAPMKGKMMRPTFQMLLHLPRMMDFAHDKWQFHRRMHKMLPDLEHRIKAVQWRSAPLLDGKTLIDATNNLSQLVKEITYFNILCPILSVMHNRLFTRQLNQLGVDLSQFDITEGLPEVDEFNPDTHLRRLFTAFTNLDPGLQAHLRTGHYAGLQEDPALADFSRQVEAFIERFGYLSDNGNDFSCPPWRESPDMVLDLILNYIPGAEEKARKVRFSELKVHPLRRPMLKAFYQRVREYRLLREQLSAQYTYTYGLFRYYYLAMGEKLVRRGLIDAASDIFYLPAEEIHALVLGNEPASDLRLCIDRHKQDMEKFQQVSLPSIIYGSQQPPVADQSSQCLYGLATSIGHYTGPVRVVRGLKDFDRVQSGDVLVIPYSDVGWAPLFARAGAVVAESGGLLSHSSIIAREYGIPAVVSVNGAMQLIDDRQVTVDGHKGEIILLPE